MDRVKQLSLLDAREEPNIGFSTSLLSQIAWPVDDPGDVERWARRNGRLLMIIQPGSEPDGQGGLRSTLVPFGVIPRYVNLFVCTEIMRTGEPELNLGDSFAGFLNKLGLRNTGGPNGTRKAVKEQMNRWLNASISFLDDSVDRRYENSRMEIKVSDGYRLLWMDGADGAPGEVLRGQSKIIVTPRFFEEVKRTFVPVDIDAVRALRGAPLRLDLFMWLNWRVFNLNHDIVVPWETLRTQFGTTDADDKDARYNFKRSITKHLATIKRAAWPELNAEPLPAGLKIQPSLSQLPQKGMRKFYLDQRAETAPVRYAEALAADRGHVVPRVPTLTPRTAVPERPAVSS